MKKYFDIIFSTKTTLILLAIFAIGSGIATFIEDKTDTFSAHKFVYGATWFEFLMILLVLNFIGNVRKFNLLSKQRFFGFIFHSAFILLILGAGVTRYFGYSGSMHIREGQSSNIVYSDDMYLQIKSDENSQTFFKNFPLPMGSLNSSFQFNCTLADEKKITVSSAEFIPNAVIGIVENDKTGTDILELKVVKNNRVELLLIKNGEIKNVGSHDLSFNNNSNPAAINISVANDHLVIKSSYDIIKTTLQDNEAEAILKDSTKEFSENHIYKTNGTMFSFTKWHKNANTRWITGKEGEKGSRVLLINVSQNKITKQIPVFCNERNTIEFQDVKIGDAVFSIGWGSFEVALPFQVQLNDFILDKYPGSTNPSSYKSEVTVTDLKRNISEKHSIFMNNVLDYRGYRFFQSSYDIDEKGTILSVSHDFYGTWISYLGYILICIGAFLTLVNKNSRFSALRESIKKTRINKKTGILIVALLFNFSSFSFSQTKNSNIISPDHAGKLGRLLVQTYDGRFEPLHTLAYDVMHKISRRGNFTVDGKGNINEMQAFMDMYIDSKFWKNQKIIYIREKSVRDILGIDGKASYNELFDQNFQYRLTEYSQISIRKNPAEQNAFDKEIIKLNERANICRMVFEGKFLKIFPVDNTQNKWIDIHDSLTINPLNSKYHKICNEFKLPALNYATIFELYIRSVYEAYQTGDFSKANKVVESISAIQHLSHAGPILPSESKINLEIFYNKAKIFENLRNIYGILSILLLSLVFYDNRSATKNNRIEKIITVLVGLLGLAFVYHTFGICLRWYISGHAPWSNGYEALLLMAWGGLFAGFYFIRNSKITLASTALLAFAVLMTASHSRYDPQITNLQPVLKSYWLIIHVAAITISYGFLGLGFILGMVNLLLYVFTNKTNELRIISIIKELTAINEMSLEIGLFLATIGTFLGGVWANESWGRYWGWDAKETWALIIVLVYAVILHLRLVPKFNTVFAFNVGSVLGFGSVIMTFIGVNYYLSKGLHSYGAGDTPVFPIWAWVFIFAIFTLITFAWVKQRIPDSEK